MRPSRIARAAVALVLGLGITALTQSLSAQNQGYLDLADQQRQIERQYERQIINALSDYYDRNRFFVDITVELEETQVPLNYEAPMFQETPLGVNALPGLPIVPEDLQRRTPAEQDTLIPTQYQTAVELVYLDIDIIADAVYDQADLNFMESRVRSVVNVDEERGDILTVSQMAFPDRGRFDDDEEEEEDFFTQEEFEEALAEQMEEFRQQLQEEEEAEAEEPEEAGWFSPDNPWLPWIILGAILFVLLIALLIYWLSKSRQPEENNHQAQELAALKAELDRIKNGDYQQPEANGQESEEEQTSAEALAKFESDKMFLTNQYINHPKRVATVLNSWFEEDPENGVMKAARAMNATNPRLLSTLRSSLDDTLYERIDQTMQHLSPMTTQESMEIVGEFKKQIQALNGLNGSAGEHSDMFQFLQDLNDDQLMNLFKEENDGIIAIALAQIDADRVANILNRMEDERRTSLMVKMGKLDNVPVQSYKQVADHLVSKALEVYNMRYVASDGVQSVLNVLDSLPVSEQQKYLDTIAQQDLELAEKIKRFFISFDEIPTMDEQQLQEALDRVNTDSLIRALVDAPQKIYDAIISVRPVREQKLIEAEVSRARDLTQQDIEKARKEILTAIRNIKRSSLA